MLSSGCEGIPGRLCYLIWKIETFWHYCKQEIKQNLTVCRKMSRRAKEARLWAAFKQEVKSSNNSCFILHTSREGLWLLSAPLSPRLCAWALLEHITDAGIYFFFSPSHTHCSAPRCPAWALRPGSARFHHRGLEQRGFCETVSTTSLFNQLKHPIYIPLLHAVARPFSSVSCALLADAFQIVLNHN